MVSATLDYLPQLALAKDFPAVAINALPSRQVTPWQLLHPRRPESFAGLSVFLERGHFTMDGRSAFAQVGQLLGLGRGDRVLVPSYHCRSMVEPFVWLGCEVDFYRLNPALEVDVRDLEARLEKQTKLVVIADFFGFVQSNPTAWRLLESAGVGVLRDCAHRLFLPTLDAPVVAAVTSLPKMLPLSLGGAWVASPEVEARVLEIARRQTGQRSDLRAFVRWGLDTWHSQSAPVSLPKLRDPALERDAGPDDAPGTGTPRPAENSDFAYFRPEAAWHALSGFEARIARAAPAERIIEKRRANFCALDAAAAQNPKVEALFKLDQTSVPYVFPIKLKAPRQQFLALRQAGVGIQRWEDIARTDCPVANAYREALVQVPCQHDITHSQLEALCEIIASV